MKLNAPARVPVRETSIRWLNALSADQRAALVAKLDLVQRWIDELAIAYAGRRRKPAAKISLTFCFYSPWKNAIAIPGPTLIGLDDRLLRLIVAHEFGHFLHRWRLPFVRTEFGRLREELFADQFAIQATRASLDDLDAAVLGVAQFEGGWEGGEAARYLATRRKLFVMTTVARHLVRSANGDS